MHLGGMLIGLIYLRYDRMLTWGARSFKGWLRSNAQARQVKRTRAEDQLRGEVDDLLDKINQVGIENLTPWERRRLREASELLKQLEDRDS